MVRVTTRESQTVHIFSHQNPCFALPYLLYLFSLLLLFFFYLFSLLLVFTSLVFLICFVYLLLVVLSQNITKSIVSNIFISDNQTLLADLQDFCHLTTNFMLISLTKDVKENFIVISCEHNGAHLVLSFEASSSFSII